MSRRRDPSPPPACYAMVVPGLEPIAAEEIEQELGGEVKRTGPGLVIFRVPEVSATLLELRTTEDIFLLAWGTDELTYRADDLEKIRHWTAREGNWQRLFRIHSGVRPAWRGPPSYHLVTQMEGPHGYRRVDARKAFARGLSGKIPPTWRPTEENAALEVWLTIRGGTAVCGVRLSDRTMRHRGYKAEHIPASLRPTVAAAMVRLADIGPAQHILDPMCGAGTILAELFEYARPERWPLQVVAGDSNIAALRAAAPNLRPLGHAFLARWDARRLPLPDAEFDRVLSNPPFGKQLSRPAEIPRLYTRMAEEANRVMRPGAVAVFLVSDLRAMNTAGVALGWKSERVLPIRILGQKAALSVWRKERR